MSFSNIKDKIGKFARNMSSFITFIINANISMFCIFFVFTTFLCYSHSAMFLVSEKTFMGLHNLVVSVAYVKT